MTSVTLVCCHAHQPDYLARLIQVHEQYPWVASILALDTSQKLPFERRGKTLFGGLDYGYGFDRQPEQGGYDEIAARESALKIARGETGQWSLIADADELYHPQFDLVLAAAERQAAAAIRVECWPVVSATNYVYYPNTVFEVDGERLHDPHVRALTKLWCCQYQRSPQHWRYANRTQHCRPERIARTLSAPGFYHFHAKAHAFTPDQLRKLPEALPEAWFSRS